MATGIKVGEVDLDDIFDPYVEGVKPAATGFKVGEVDLSERYAPVGYGASAPATGMKISSGADLNTLWAMKGTAAYRWTISSIATSTTGGSVSASIKAQVKSDGRIVFVAGRGGTLHYVKPNEAGAGAAYQFRMAGNATAVGTASLTGKITPIFGTQPPYGNTKDFDTGWLAADDTNDFLTMAADSSGNLGMRSVDGSMLVQIKRISDGAIVRTLEVLFSCIADAEM